MRILIDECLDWRLCRTLPGHDCSSAQEMGWSGLTNGALLEKAAQEFDVFLTGDRNLTFQQTPSRFDLAVVILHAESIQFASHGYSNAKGSLRASYASARSGRRRFWLRGLPSATYFPPGNSRFPRITAWQAAWWSDPAANA